MCTFQPVLSTPDAPKAEQIMEALQKQRDRGAKVYGQTMPRCFDLNMGYLRQVCFYLECLLRNQLWIFQQMRESSFF